MAVRSNRRQVVERISEGSRAGLLAAAAHYRNAMMLALRGGYTTGAFYSGLQGVAGSVVVGEPVVVGGVEWSVQVGTNVPYAKFWELGHYNIFTARRTGTVGEFFATGGYQRVEKWRPTLVQEAPTMLQRFVTTFRQVAQAEVAVGGLGVGLAAPDVG